MGSFGALMQYDWCPYKKGKFGYRQTYTEEIWSYRENAIYKKCKRLPEITQKRKAWNRSCFMALRRKNPVDLRHPASKTVRQYISVVLSHWICGILLWWS